MHVAKIANQEVKTMIKCDIQRGLFPDFSATLEEMLMKIFVLLLVVKEVCGFGKLFQYVTACGQGVVCD